MTPDSLRLILIIIGVLILVAIYVSGRRKEDGANKGADAFPENFTFHFEHPSLELPTLTKPAKKTQFDDISAEFYQEADRQLSYELSKLNALIAERGVKPPEQMGDMPPEAVASEIHSAQPIIDSAITENAMDAMSLEAAETEITVTKKRKPRTKKAKTSSSDAIEATPPVDPASIPPEELIVLHILAAQDGSFQGNDILKAVEATGLSFGVRDIFHRLSPIDVPVFSLANMLQPGRFDLAEMDSFYTTGLILFLALPGPVDALIAYDDMLAAGRSLAAELDGVLCDEARNILTLQAIEYTHDRLRDFNYKLLIARKRADQE